MRKLFSFVTAMLVALAVNAATINVSPGVNTLKTAVATAEADDVLELGDGIFYEEGNFDMKKNLTIKAAESAKPVIANRYYFRVEGGASITFKGLKFDGASWRSGDDEPIGASDHCVRSYTNSTGEENVVFEDCEFTGYPSYILYTQRANRRWNSITIRNCYFYNNKRSAVAIINESGDNQSCNALTIENSTFANFAGSENVINYAAPDAEHTTTLNVDHCTFYGFPKRAIYWEKSENLLVSNCIFSQPTTNTYKSVECIGGTIKNCLSYFTAGYSSAATRTDNINEDPLFVDAANGDYRLALNSPARKAGSDGKTLGDPRWWPMYQVSTHSIDFGDVEKGSGSAMESFYLKGADLTANVRIYDFTIPYGAVFSKYPAAVTPVEAEYPNGKKVEVYAAKYVDVAEYKGYLVLESPDFPNDTIWLRANIVEPAPAEPKTLYLKISDDWKYPSKYAIYYFDDNSNTGWSDFMALAAGEEDIYTATIPAEYADDKIIFVRFNSTKESTGNWDEKWSQTINLEIPEGKDMFTITSGGTGDQCDGKWSKYGYVPVLENGYYLVGNFADVPAWGYEDLTAAKKFVVNPDNAEEYQLENVTLAAEDSIKVVYVENDEIQWYAPKEANYAVDANHAGVKTVYFRPSGNGGEDWWYGCIYVPANSEDPTAIENTNAAIKTVKMIENGQMIIIKNGVKYNAQGAIVK